MFHCKHKSTRGIGLGYALCNDCGGWLPDVLFPRSASNPGGYPGLWERIKMRHSEWCQRSQRAHDLRATRAGRARWDECGPCAPQCHAECDGVCSAAYRATGELI
jgi:hypothetical protein